MADINTTSPADAVSLATKPSHAPSHGRSMQALVEMVELLFFAYRDFTGEPDAILQEIGFGRAHHRVLHFVNRNPGLRVADLLNLLRITKQSLARVLKQLVDEGYILQERPEQDRRERRLHLTAKGADLAERLLTMQTQRVAAALGSGDKGTESTARDFLVAMISEADRAEIEQLLSSKSGTSRLAGGDTE